MKVPWRFILALCGGVAAGAAFFIGLLYAQLGVPTESSRYLYEVVQKKQELAAAIPGPRLLIVAGSGSFYGLNAKRIEERTGRKTLNLACFAGFGAPYILYTAKKTARPGDTVLLALEYELYSFSAHITAESLDDYLISRDPEYFRQMPLFDKIDLATRVPWKRIQKGLSIQIKPERPPRPHHPYVESLDENGDELENKTADRQPDAPSMKLKATNLLEGIASTDRPGFNSVRKFVQWARAHQVTVLATFPNIMYHPEYDGPNARQAIRTIRDFYASLGVPVVGTAQEAMLPEDQFFNTLYHLTHEAALNRTDHLVPELEPYLKAAPP